jgi:hypothetical protein
MHVTLINVHNTYLRKTVVNVVHMTITSHVVRMQTVLGA